MGDAVVPVVRVINSLIVSDIPRMLAAAADSGVPFPTETFRGVTMPAEEFDFFTPEKMYRVPMFLATTTRKNVAESFIRENLKNGLAAVYFTLTFDPILRCSHVRHIQE